MKKKSQRHRLVTKKNQIRTLKKQQMILEKHEKRRLKNLEQKKSIEYKIQKKATKKK